MINGAGHGGVGGAKVGRGDVQRVIVGALGRQRELDGAIVALAVAVAGVAVAGEAHGPGAVAGERDEAEAVGYELVIEDGGVHLDLDQVDGDGRHLGNHHPPERVRHGGIGVAQLELAVVVLHLPDPHPREPLVARSSDAAVHRRRRQPAETLAPPPFGEEEEAEFF